MRRGKYTFPAALFLPGTLTLNMTNVILNEVKNPRNRRRSGYIGKHTPKRGSLYIFASKASNQRRVSTGCSFDGA